MIEFKDIEPEFGKCFDNVFEFMELNILEHPTLAVVHGIVKGEGKINGVDHSHAWIQYEDTRFNGLLFAIDPSYDVCWPWDFYMHKARCKDFTVYPMAQYYTIINEVENTGPWEERYDYLTGSEMRERGEVV